VNSHACHGFRGAGREKSESQTRFNRVGCWTYPYLVHVIGHCSAQLEAWHAYHVGFNNSAPQQREPSKEWVRCRAVSPGCQLKTVSLLSSSPVIDHPSVLPLSLNVWDRHIYLRFGAFAGWQGEGDAISPPPTSSRRRNGVHREGDLCRRTMRESKLTSGSRGGRLGTVG